MSEGRYKIYNKEREQWLTLWLSSNKTIYTWVDDTKDWYGESLIDDLIRAGSGQWDADIDHNPLRTFTRINMVNELSEFFIESCGWDNVVIVPLIHGEPDFTKAMV